MYKKWRSLTRICWNVSYFFFFKVNVLKYLNISTKCDISYIFLISLLVNELFQSFKYIIHEIDSFYIKILNFYCEQIECITFLRVTAFNLKFNDTKLLSYNDVFESLKFYIRTYVYACVRVRARSRVCVCVCVCLMIYTFALGLNYSRLAHNGKNFPDS